MEEIIFKHLNRERLTSAEQAKLENWLTTDPKNPKVFNQLKLNLNGATPGELKNMKDEVWKHLSDKIEQPEPNQSVFSWLKIAAVIILTIGLGAVAYFETSTLNRGKEETRFIIEKESLNGQKLSFILPDGSSVKLNAGSKILFPKEFDHNSRNIELVGEAYFDVVRDESRPFLISTENFEVEVLGTSFNVKAYPDDDIMAVAVRSGKVNVEIGPSADEFLLGTEEMVSYLVEENRSKKEQLSDSQLVFGWTEKKLIYENAQITEIFKDLSRWYGVEFEVIRSLDYSKRISGRYDNPSLIDVLNSLSFAYEFEFLINDKKIIIK